MKQKILNKILELYKKWLHNEPDGDGERAYLVNTDLPRTDLRSADSHCVDLSGADLSGADLCDTSF